MALTEMSAMALPVFLTKLDILSIREDDSRILIGPKGELAGFRQTDFLEELKVVRRWLRNQTGIEEVLIDVENCEYLRGRILAGLVLLREEVPEGARFGIVGESEQLDAVLDKMNVSDAVPVFPDQASAFDHTPPSRWRILAARTKSKLDGFRSPLLVSAAVVVIVATFGAAGLQLFSDPVQADYASLLSTWQQALQRRQSSAKPAELEEQLTALRLQVDDLVVCYVQKASPDDDEAQLLEAARALSTNLKFLGRHGDSERKFHRAMQRVAAWHAMDELPQPDTQSLSEYDNDNPSD